MARLRCLRYDKGVEKMNTEKLQKQMAKKAMNNSQLSKSVGVSEPYISMIVNGLRIPNVLVAKKIATALECKIEDLL